MKTQTTPNPNNDNDKVYLAKSYIKYIKLKKVQSWQGQVRTLNLISFKTKLDWLHPNEPETNSPTIYGTANLIYIFLIIIYLNSLNKNHLIVAFALSNQITIRFNNLICN